MQIAPEPFELSPQGLVVHGSPTFEQWATFGGRLFGIKSAVQWAMGDWINYGETRWGEKYAQALDVFDLDYGYLRNLAWIASRFDLSRRRVTLSWSHHAVTAPLETAQQDGLLLEAQTKQLSRDDLRERVRAIKAIQSGTPVTQPAATPAQPVVTQPVPPAQPIVEVIEPVRHEVDGVVAEVGVDAAAGYITFHCPGLSTLQPGQQVKIIVYVKE